jgi:hypothetical protein
MWNHPRAMALEPGRGAEQEPAHDVLAAEAFAVPAPDPALRQRTVVLPDDPSGIAEPHDILAAEEFAMPAATPPQGATRGLARGEHWWLVVGAAAALGAALALMGRRRRR